MLGAGETEPPGKETQWKLFRWGNPATLLIQNGILTGTERPAC